MKSRVQLYLISGCWYAQFRNGATYRYDNLWESVPWVGF